MVFSRLNVVGRYGKVLLKALSSWVAKGCWIIPVYISCTYCAFTIAHDVSVPTTSPTTYSTVVDSTNVSGYRITYYPASFEAEDHLPILQGDQMSFNQKQLREKITAVLQWLEPEIPYSETAVELLMLTCAQESHLGQYLKQVKGPARGIFQVEPFTETDMWRSLANGNNEQLRQKLGELMFIGEPKGITNMEMNLAYQIAMARYYYFRIPAPLPDKDVAEMAMYWKKYYNTRYGKGTVAEAHDNYKRYCS